MLPLDTVFTWLLVVALDLSLATWPTSGTYDERVVYKYIYM